MTDKPTPEPAKTESGTSRRKFIAATAGATAAASALPIESYAQVAGSDEIKVGMIGCGGRNSGAIVQNLTANDSARLVAIADAFQDKIDGTGPRGQGLPIIQKQMEKNGSLKQVDVPESRQYAGFDAYKEVIDQVDLVCIATPPGFRPIHFEYAVQAGKNVFMEKPVCVDAHGYNRIIEAAKVADQKNLKVVVGLQRHYQNVYLEAFKKVHEEGLIGDIVSAQCWWNGSRPWIIERQPGWNEMTYQMRNWYHFVWLCGDHIAEQHIHNIDVINWFVSGDSAMGGHPISAQGMGGRAGTEPLTVGEIYDHHYVEFRFGPEHNNVVMNSQCRQIKNTWRRVAEEIHGTDGILYLAEGKITDLKGNVKWQHRLPRGEKDPNPYDVEHEMLHKHIREDIPINNAYYGAKSSFTTTLGRLATYSGQEITWDEAVKSDFSIMPEVFAFDAEAPVQPGPDGNYQLAIPGEWPLPWKA
ncbi:MAG: Gfo/Idh/MocA family oxidoreductase [Verrucomicrobiae bacterium]|nr:Gfo/Idh/MocA family oxidoreductase [Verrucomicrobiae bacterium]